MKKRIKINGIIIFLAVMALFIFPKVFMRSFRSYTGTLVQAAGFLLVILGQLIRASARGFKAENSSSGETLVKNGPYSLVRNPMYLGILCIGTGIVFMLFKWWIAAVFLVIFVLRYILLIFEEEKKLLAVFGQDFKDYQKKVPRLLPRPCTICTRNLKEYLPLRLPWIKKELGSIIPVWGSIVLFKIIQILWVYPK